MAQKEKEKKEEKLRELAKMARDRRAGIKAHGEKGMQQRNNLNMVRNTNVYYNVIYNVNIKLVKMHIRVVFSVVGLCCVGLMLRVLLGGEETEVRERDEIRQDRRKERQHDRNISRAAPDKRYMAFIYFLPS